jgi:hypothetical protein
LFVDGLDFGLNFYLDVIEKKVELLLGDFPNEFFLFEERGRVECGCCGTELS